MTVVVPALNEQDSIGELVEQIEAAFATCPEVAHSIVIVDDGSSDGTGGHRRRPGAPSRGPGASAPSQLRQGLGLAVGADAATGPILITMDADLQDDLPRSRFLDALAAGPDLVSGWKRDRQDPLSKRLPSRLFNRITSMVSAKPRDHNCGFKAAARDLHVVPTASSTGTSRRWRRHGLRGRRWRSTTGPRHGHSKFGFERYLRGLLDLFTVLVITRHGRRPGHFFGGIGIVAALVGFLILTYLTGVWVFTDDLIGNRPCSPSGCCWRWRRCSSWPWGSSPS